MKTEAYELWLTKTWAPERLQTIVERRGRHRGERLYTEAAVTALSDAYSRLNNWTPAVGTSLTVLLSTVLRPYLPEDQPRVGIFFRDWPVPCKDKPAFAPEERGAAPVPADIMAGSIERVFASDRPAYATLRRGFNAGFSVARHLGFDEGPDLESFVRKCVVGDLVKIQALFAREDGSPFKDSLSKSSCHSRGMYALGAAPLKRLRRMLFDQSKMAFRGSW